MDAHTPPRADADTDTRARARTRADANMDTPHRHEPRNATAAAHRSTPASGLPRRDRRALLGAALGAAATIAIAPIAASARTVTVQGFTGTIGATGATGPVGATGGAVPQLTVTEVERFAANGTGFYLTLYCPEPDMIPFSFGWKNLPPDWMAWRQYYVATDNPYITVGFIDNTFGGEPNEGTVEMQLFCMKATGVVS